MASSKIYVRAITGYYQKLRQKITWVLMLLFIALPWLNYQQRQAILFDIEHQQFHLFSTTLWPQDFTILALIFIIAAFALFFYYHVSGSSMVWLPLPTDSMERPISMVGRKTRRPGK